MPKPEHPVRDEQIFEEWLDGKSQRDLAKKHGITPNRIRQIIQHQKLLHYKTTNVKHYLVNKYPQYNRCLIIGAVNAVLRSLRNDPLLKHPLVADSKAYFFSHLTAMSNEDITSLRAVGEKKSAFLIKIRDDWKLTIT